MDLQYGQWCDLIGTCMSQLRHSLYLERGGDGDGDGDGENGEDGGDHLSRLGDLDASELTRPSAPPSYHTLEYLQM